MPQFAPTPSPPDTGPPHWNPWGIGLVCAFCVFFLLFSYHRIFGRHCTRNPSQRRRLSDNIEEPSSQLQSQGLESYTMHSIPITQFKKRKDAEMSPSTTDCAICLGELEEDEWVKHLPNCSHVFHVSCIDTWFQTHSSCPICRTYVYSHAMHHECSVSMYSLLETLNREDFHAERSERYQVLRAHILENVSIRADTENRSQFYSQQS